MCPMLFWSQPMIYQSSDTLDEFVIDGIEYEEHHYFLFSKGVYNIPYDDYDYYLVKFDSALIPIGILDLDSIGDYSVYPWKTQIYNDTIYIFGSAQNSIINDNQIYLAKATLELDLIDVKLIGKMDTDENFSSAYLDADNNFVLAGSDITDFNNIPLIVMKITKGGEVLNYIVDTTWKTVGPEIVYLQASQQYHFVDHYITSIYNFDLDYDSYFFTKQNMWFRGYTDTYGLDKYFIGGNRWLGTKKSFDIMEMSYFLINSDSEAIDSGYISIPDVDDCLGGLDFDPPNSLIYGGVSNYHLYPGQYPIFFEEELRSIVVQNLNFDTKNENWLFSYGGDANYYMIGLYSTELSNEVIVYADKYDWVNTDRYDRDIIILKIDSTGILVSNEDQIDPIEKPMLYPNPGKSYVMVESQYQLSEVIFYDVYGRIVSRKGIDSRKAKIETENLMTGTYIYKVFDKNSNYVYSGIWIKQ